MPKNFLIILSVVAVAFAGIMGCGTTSPGTGTVSAIRVSMVGSVPQPLPAGTSAQLLATATLEGGGTENVTSLATWSTSNAAVATVTSGGTISAVGPGTATITCTYQGVTGTIVVTVAAGASLRAIAISPANASGAPGTTRQFAAQGTYSDGSVRNVTSTVAWSSSSGSVATISPAGLATAVAAGSTTITATLSGVTGTTTFTVTAATVESINVTPSNPTIASGATLQFHAVATFSDNTTQDVTSSVTWASGEPSIAVIDSTGLASSIRKGTAPIVATLGSLTAQTTLTVTAATLTGISISPSNPSIHVGTSQQFTATGHYSDNSTQNLTSSVSWSSSAAAIVSINSGGLATANAVGTATITATSPMNMPNSFSAQVSVTATSATLSSIAVSPSNPSVAAGSSEQFTATGTFGDGSTQNLTSSVIWSSSSTATATIDAQGLATTAAAGTTTISAAYGPTTATTTLTVTAATVDSISVTPSNPTFAAGTQTQFTAIATYSDGTTQNVTSSVAWSSSGPAVAIDSNGLATGESVGSATITASFGGATTSTNVTISAATLSSIAVSPTDPSIAAGTSQQFTATGYFSDGSQQNLTSYATWTSSSNAVSINAQGLATANSTGTATITGAYQGMSASATITITPATLESITITPSNPSIAAGTTVQFHAEGTYSDGSMQDLTGSLNWTSSSSAVVSISSTGLATGVGQGSATISGNSGSVSQTTQITITPATLSSIAVTPQTASIAAGTNQQFTATGTFSDASTQNLTSQVTWSSSSSAASINASGVATGASPGTATITAAYSGTTSNGATLTVTAATLQSISLAPANPSAPAGETAQLTATGHFSDGSTQDLTSTVSWSSSDTMTATVSPSGIVTAKKSGTATITATDGAIANSVTFTAGSPVLVSLAITPANPSAPSGETAQLTLTGTFSDGSTQDETGSAAWSTSSNAVATVSTTGLVTAGAQGTATITAAVGSVNTSVTFTSSAPALQTITISPSSPSIPAGETQQLTATGHYSDGSTQNLTNTAAWTSSAASTATVNSTGLVTAKAQGSATISAGAGSVSGTATVTVTAAGLQSIAISPANPSQPAGSAQQFTATGTYSDGSTQDISSSVTWSSSNATVATINSSGLATTKQTGTSTIAAAMNSLGAQTTLTVTAAQLVSMNVTPSANPDAYHANSKTVGVGAARAIAGADGAKAEGLPGLNGIITTIALGTEQQFIATGTYTDGSTHDLTQTATWNSVLPGVAELVGPGLVLAEAIGTTEIGATQDGVSGATTLNVTPAILASIAIIPVNPSTNVGAQVQFVATGTFTDGSTQDITATATWTSSATGVATVSNLGLATGVGIGTTTIGCAQGSTNNSTTLTVNPAALLSIAVTPSAPSLPNGLVEQFFATGTYTDGSTRDLSTSVTWSSSSTGVATITPLGLADAKSVGTTTIAAALGSVSGGTTLTVVGAQLESITVTPPSPSIAAGTAEQFIAWGNYSDSSTQLITPLVNWTSSSPSVATIAATGLASALAQGTTTISATLGSVTGTTGLTVTPATLVSIAVTPLADTVPLGGTVQYTATGTFSDLSTQNLTSTVTWTATPSSVAVITNGGLATSSGVGLATVKATLGSVSGSAALTVTSAALVSISLSPSNATCPAGGTEQLGATGIYSDGSQLSLTDLVSWTSSNASLATVNSSGLVSCIAAGSPVITATLLEISSNTTVTVTNATLQSITVTAATAQATLGILDQMTATGHYSDGSTRNITSSVTWSVAPVILATINSSGGLLAVGVGSCTVTATVGSISGSTTVNLLL